MNNATTLKPRLTDLQVVALYGDQLRKKEQERQRARRREYYARNRERILAQARARRAANPERTREQDAERYARTYHSRRQSLHGPALKSWQKAAWRAQGGRCYLCQRPLDPDLIVVIEHDHRCCPSARSCEVCRRGLACNPCNRVVGLAGDDPDRLELIAAGLRAAKAAVTARLIAREA